MSTLARPYAEAKPLIFCHFAGGPGEKIYNDIDEFSTLQKILEDTLSEYNETNATMDLVLFEVGRCTLNPGITQV